MSEDYIKKLWKFAEDLYINKLDHDPCDDGLFGFCEGFIEGVIAHDKGEV